MDGLPIKEGTEEQRKDIITIVKNVLNNPYDYESLHKMDQIVYDINGISEYEIPIIEG